MTNFNTLWAVASFLLVHTALVAYYAGKVIEALTDLRRRAEHWDSMIDEGKFPHCMLHRQQISNMEHRIEKIESRIEKKG